MDKDGWTKVNKRMDKRMDGLTQVGQPHILLDTQTAGLESNKTPDSWSELIDKDSRKDLILGLNTKGRGQNPSVCCLAS